ncbi:hypothetical protein RHGRI_035236 [Rhododendron griersonianum]|uniref:Uncharacterized protein n=1 Tax=Rhododendron griersonianum TaxID=479676 RepID=A0AAV6I6F2_9ERIC|nr:hypothetical protein RHGRI_035236 [Rhododendron griersonianum]
MPLQKTHKKTFLKFLLDQINISITRPQKGNFFEILTINNVMFRYRDCFKAFKETKLDNFDKSNEVAVSLQILSKKIKTDAREIAGESVKKAQVLEEEARIQATKLQLESDIARVNEELNQLKSSLNDSKKVEQELEKSITESGSDKVHLLSVYPLEM